jgi:AcrR family transcriptional regulator
MAKHPVRRRGRPRAAEQAPDAAEKLLLTAMSAFAGRGFDSVGLREIAAVAEVDPTLVKHHYGSKLGLWKACVDDISARLISGVSGAVANCAPAQTPQIRLAAIIDRLVDVTCDTPHLANFILLEITQQDERFEYIYVRLVMPMHDVLRPAVEAACAGGALAPADPDFVFLSIAGAIVTTVASRGFLARLSPHASVASDFRLQLKRAVLAPLGALPSVGGAHLQ